MSQVSVKLSKHFQSFITLVCLLQLASKGSGAYLLKAGSKRRRKQADILGEEEEKEMSA